MNLIPQALKPLVLNLVDYIGACRGLFLPGYFNLKIKLRYILRGIDEPDIAFIAAKYIKRGDTVIDVGANVGLTARAFARATGPTGKVHAIEPERSNFSFLCANTLKYPWVIAHRCAFSADSGTRELHLNPISGTGNSFFSDSMGEIQKVPCITFDDFCYKEEINRIDCIKIDVEGAEIEVLRGMKNTLKRFPALILLIELCPSNLHRAGSSAEELLECIAQGGFIIHVLEEHGSSFRVAQYANPLDALGNKAYMNLLCSSKELV